MQERLTPSKFYLTRLLLVANIERLHSRNQVNHDDKYFLLTSNFIELMSPESYLHARMK